MTVRMESIPSIKKAIVFSPSLEFIWIEFFLFRFLWISGVKVLSSFYVKKLLPRIFSALFLWRKFPFSAKALLNLQQLWRLVSFCLSGPFLLVGTFHFFFVFILSKWKTLNVMNILSMESNLYRYFICYLNTPSNVSLNYTLCPFFLLTIYLIYCAMAPTDISLLCVS